MLRGTSVMNLCSARFLRQRQEIRDDLRDKLDAIRRYADPFTGEDADRPFMIPRGHDPFDIWHKILEFVTGPEEIIALWEAHPLFREILNQAKAKYIQARLPEIIHIILVERPCLLLDSESKWVRVFIHRLKKTLPLSLRFISSLCKKSVEGLLQTADHGFGTGKLYLTLQTGGQIQGMIDDILGKEFKACFIPPNVEAKAGTLWLSSLEKEAYLKSIRAFLELVGKRVKTFRCISEDLDAPQDVYQILSEWVLHMPNLENLELFSDFIMPRRSIGPTFDELLAFPNCPKLRSFTLLSMPPKPYLQHILNANPNIKILSLPKLHQREKFEFIEPSEMDSTLKHLECLHNIPLYDSLVSYLEFKLPLKEIIFHSSFLTSHSSSFKELFPFLHQFRNTLERLDLPRIEVDMTGSHYLDLPRLKSFKWWYNITFQDLQFLLYAEHLEEIEMLVEEKDIIDVDSFSDSFLMEVTNGFDGLSLWDVFHRFKIFLIRFPSRGDYREMIRTKP